MSAEEENPLLQSIPSDEDEEKDSPHQTVIVKESEQSSVTIDAPKTGKEVKRAIKLSREVDLDTKLNQSQSKVNSDKEKKDGNESSKDRIKRCMMTSSASNSTLER